MYQERFYRRWVAADDLVTFEVKVAETDLQVSCDKVLDRQIQAVVLHYRKEIQGFIKKDRRFLTSLEPIAVKMQDVPPIVRAMLEASQAAGVGPMAAVAGAIAEFVCRDMLSFAREIIIENGGDIFIRSLKKRRIGIFAGESPFSGKLAIEIEPDEKGVSVCTSSGTVSHSLSFGNADVSLIISPNGALADAMATAMGNVVKTKADVQQAVDFAKSVKGVTAALAIIGDTMATWGAIKFAS